MSTPMTSDLDRVLTDWLGDGPRRAPEHVLAAALDHARSHPRRPDPLRAFRPDVMPAPGRGGLGVLRGGLVLRPVGAVLLLSLLLAAVVGVGLIGSQGRDPVVVPPVATPSPSPSPSDSPSPTPTPEPTTIALELDVFSGVPASMVVTDASGRVVGARSGTPADGVSVENGVVVFEQLSPTEVAVRWSAISCASSFTLAIDAAATTYQIEAPFCDGDSIGRDLVLILEFDAAVDAGSLTGSMTTLPPPA